MAVLVPILCSTGVGLDIMKAIAAPTIGGMVTATIHVLIITPVIFYLMKTVRYDVERYAHLACTCDVLHQHVRTWQAVSSTPSMEGYSKERGILGW